jgi:hypothetical protein
LASAACLVTEGKRGRWANLVRPASKALPANKGSAACLENQEHKGLRAKSADKAMRAPQANEGSRVVLG